jgi:hypothetical protein
VSWELWGLESSFDRCVDTRGVSARKERRHDGERKREWVCEED